eukprot:GSChrysophyteH2.ASY1.ANO1.683.1 assembled CDS
MSNANSLEVQAQIGAGLEADKMDEHMKAMWAGQSNVLVSVRVRPLMKHDVIKKSCVRVLDSKVVVILDPKAEKPDVLRVNRTREKQYAFDYVFEPSSSQEATYHHTTKFLLHGVLDGFNATVFAYGQTGSGKTFTMIGTQENPGIMVRVMNDLFMLCSQNANTAAVKHKVVVSFLEVYNENIRDLLSTVADAEEYLDLREDPIKGPMVAGITEVEAKSGTEVMNLLHQGNAKRSQAATAANEVSSRSHAVLQVLVETRDRAPGVADNIKVGKLSLIDLAGSERAANTQNRGARLVEGANINRSLLALGNCINALGEKGNKGNFVPYRDSKLTRLLKDSLGGNCRTVMIANISPAESSFEETLNTLKYANRAKNIKTEAKRNVLNVNYHISEYVELINNLRGEIKMLKDQMEVPAPADSLSDGGGNNLAPELAGGDSSGGLSRGAVGSSTDRGETRELVNSMRQMIVSNFQERMQLRRSLIELEDQNVQNSIEVSKRQLIVVQWTEASGVEVEPGPDGEHDLGAHIIAKAPPDVATAWRECEQIRKAVNKNNSMKRSIAKRLRHNEREAERVRDELGDKITGEDRRELMELQYQQHRIVHESILKGKDLVIQKLKLQLAVKDKIISRQQSVLQKHNLEGEVGYSQLAVLEQSLANMGEAGSDVNAMGNTGGHTQGYANTSLAPNSPPRQIGALGIGTYVGGMPNRPALDAMPGNPQGSAASGGDSGNRYPITQQRIDGGGNPHSDSKDKRNRPAAQRNASLDNSLENSITSLDNLEIDGPMNSSREDEQYMLPDDNATPTSIMTSMIPPQRSGAGNKVRRSNADREQQSKEIQSKQQQRAAAAADAKINAISLLEKEPVMSSHHFGPIAGQQAPQGGVIRSDRPRKRPVQGSGQGSNGKLNSPRGGGKPDMAVQGRAGNAPLAFQGQAAPQAVGPSGPTGRRRKKEEYVPSSWESKNSEAVPQPTGKVSPIGRSSPPAVPFESLSKRDVHQNQSQAQAQSNQQLAQARHAQVQGAGGGDDGALFTNPHNPFTGSGGEGKDSNTELDTPLFTIERVDPKDIAKQRQRVSEQQMKANGGKKGGSNSGAPTNSNSDRSSPGLGKMSPDRALLDRDSDYQIPITINRGAVGHASESALHPPNGMGAGGALGNVVRDDNGLPSNQQPQPHQQQKKKADVRRRPMGAMGASRQKGNRERGGINNDLEEGSVETVYSEDSDGSFTKETSAYAHSGSEGKDGEYAYNDSGSKTRGGRSPSPPPLTSADRAYQAAQAQVAAHAQQQQALQQRQQMQADAGNNSKKDAVIGKLRRGAGGSRDPYDPSFGANADGENAKGNMAPISVGGNIINADISRAQKRAEAGGLKGGAPVARGVHNQQIAVGGSAINGGAPISRPSNGGGGSNAQPASLVNGQRRSRPKPRVPAQGNPN